MQVSTRYHSLATGEEDATDSSPGLEALAALLPGGRTEVRARLPTGVVTLRPLSFTSVSLAPPMVGFVVRRSEGGWAELEAQDATYEVRLRAVTAPGQRGPAPVLAVIRGTFEDQFATGDSDFILLRVSSIEGSSADLDPAMLAGEHQGTFRPLEASAIHRDIVAALPSADQARKDVLALARALDAEITLSTVVGDECLLLSSCGPPHRSGHARAGRRVPFRAPMGAVVASWSSSEVRHRWADQQHRSACDDLVGRVRAEGYAVATGYGTAVELTRELEAVAEGSAHSEQRRDQLIRAMILGYNPPSDPSDRMDLAYLTVPVPDPRAAGLCVTAWGDGTHRADRNSIQAALGPMRAVARRIADRLG